MPTSVNHGNSTGPIVPDHIVFQTQADLAEGVDSVLAFVLSLIRGTV
jgi:hypothetical protein